MRSLPILPLAAMLLLPLESLKADEDRWEPPGPYQVAAEAAEEAPEFEGETEDSDLGFGPEGPDLDIEGAATEEDTPEVDINGFGRNGR